MCNFISEGKPSYPLSGDDYFVCRVNRFRVMIDFMREPNKFQILRIRISCGAFDGGLFFCLNAFQTSELQKIFLYYKQQQKIYILTD